MSQNHEPVLIVDPVIGLKKKLSLPGGISREAALARAHDRLQEQRKEAIDDLVTRIAALRQMGDTLDGMLLTKQDMSDLQEQLDEILNIAGTFHMWNLVTTAAFLYDLLRSRTARHRLNADSLNTFIHAMQLFAIPSGRYEEDGLVVLEQLRRLFEFFAPGQVPRQQMLGAA